MANETLIFLACNIYSILAEYSLQSGERCGPRASVFSISRDLLYLFCRVDFNFSCTLVCPFWSTNSVRGPIYAHVVNTIRNYGDEPTEFNFGSFKLTIHGCLLWCWSCFIMFCGPSWSIHVCCVWPVHWLATFNRDVGEVLFVDCLSVRSCCVCPCFVMLLPVATSRVGCDLWL